MGELIASPGVQLGFGLAAFLLALGGLGLVWMHILDCRSYRIRAGKMGDQADTDRKTMSAQIADIGRDVAYMRGKADGQEGLGKEIATALAEIAKNGDRN